MQSNWILISEYNLTSIYVARKLYLVSERCLRSLKHFISKWLQHFFWSIVSKWSNLLFEKIEKLIYLLSCRRGLWGSHYVWLYHIHMANKQTKQFANYIPRQKERFNLVINICNYSLSQVWNNFYQLPRMTEQQKERSNCAGIFTLLDNT